MSAFNFSLKWVLNGRTKFYFFTNRFKLRQDGKVIYKHPSIRDASGDLIESAFSTYNFCVDGIRHWGEPEGPYRNAEDQTILFVCAVNPPAP